MYSGDLEMKLKQRRAIDEKVRVLTGSRPYPLELYEEKTGPEEDESGGEGGSVPEGPLSRFPATPYDSGGGAVCRILCFQYAVFGLSDR
jgi:hypothetical protein